MHDRLAALDDRIFGPLSRRLPAHLVEFLAFGWKEALSCVFPVAMFALLALTRFLPIPLPRYDLILIAALGVQWGLWRSGLEDGKEIRMITAFHVAGLLLELFKTSSFIASWSYPEFAYTKIAGVPLYSGFLYASVGSYIVQAWKHLHLSFTGLPRTRVMLPLALLIYANFFTHHYLPDLRWWLTAATLLVFGRSWVHFRPWRHHYRLPLTLSFFLIGFFIWLAENIATGLAAYQYPNQHAGWALVDLGKLSSWALLVIFSFVLVATARYRGDEVSP